MSFNVRNRACKKKIQERDKYAYFSSHLFPQKQVSSSVKHLGRAECPHRALQVHHDSQRPSQHCDSTHDSGGTALVMHSYSALHSTQKLASFEGLSSKRYSTGMLEPSS